MATVEQIDQVTELKERLFHRIETTHNMGVLRGVLLLLEEIPEKRIYILSPEEEKMVEERCREMDNGVGIPHEEVRREVEEWFLRKRPLTAEQLEDIEISRQQIAAGLTISHEDVVKELDALYPDDEDDEE